MNALRHVLSELVVERVGFGIFVLDRELNVVMWNRFMQDHSGKTAEQVIGKSIFASFPELPRVWLTRKVESVFQLGSFAFSSWEQRPYLFRFDHDRPITGGVDFMQQDCTFMPLTHEREVMAVCITISDVTHASMMQRGRDEAVAKLQEYADRDGLTGIANRRYFELRLADEFSRWQRYGGELSLLLFDLDYFKRINDEFGHLVGDTVLRVMAERVEPDRARAGRVRPFRRRGIRAAAAMHGFRGRDARRGKGARSDLRDADRRAGRARAGHGELRRRAGAPGRHVVLRGAHQRSRCRALQRKTARPEPLGRLRLTPPERPPAAAVSASKAKHCYTFCRSRRCCRRRARVCLCGSARFSHGLHRPSGA